MHSLSTRGKSALVTVALLGIFTFVLLVCATEAYAAFRLEYIDGVKPTDGIAVSRTAPQAALGQEGYPLATGRATVTHPAPASRMAIPAHIVNCESGGSYTAENPTSTASGKYQLIQSTADGLARRMGRPDLVGVPASQWAPHLQDRAAALLWDGGRGASHWAQCL